MKAKEPVLRNKLQLFIAGLIFFNFFCSIFSLYAQENTDTSLLKYNSFRLKYDAGQWICQYPNIEVEYRFSNKIAVNASGIYLKRGTIWPLTFIATRQFFGLDKKPIGTFKNIIEQTPLKGYMIKAGVKLYLKKEYFISPLFYFRDESYKDIEWDPGFESGYRESLSVKDYCIGLTFGNEGNKRKYAFGEWYVGMGLSYSFWKKTILQYLPDSKSIKYNSKNTKLLPTIFFGYNIGIRMGKNISPGSKLQSEYELPKNSVFYEVLGNGFFGSFNYERVLFYKNSFYLNGRIGLGYMPDLAGRSIFFAPFVLFSTQYQFSKRCSFEAGFGIRFDLVGYIDKIYQPDLISQFCFRYNGPKGFLMRAGFMPVIITELVDWEYPKYGLIQPGISFGYSFGKKK